MSWYPSNVRLNITGDKETPCANCKKASINCARAKKFRIKKLITTENTFKFDPNQTWIDTPNQGKSDLCYCLQLFSPSSTEKSNKISFVDETSSASRHSRTVTAESPSSEDGPQSESLDFAASVLRSLSKGSQVLPDEQEAPLVQALSGQSPDVFEASRTHEDGGFSAPRDLSQLSISVSPTGRPSLSASHFGSPSLPVLSTQWQQSSPDQDTRMYLNHGGTGEGSPFGTGTYNDNHLYQADTLPSIMDLELHNPTSLLSASSSQSLSLEEACLVRCFVEKLARAVRNSMLLSRSRFD